MLYAENSGGQESATGPSLRARQYCRIRSELRTGIFPTQNGHTTQTERSTPGPMPCENGPLWENWQWEPKHKWNRGHDTAPLHDSHDTGRHGAVRGVVPAGGHRLPRADLGLGRVDRRVEPGRGGPGSRRVLRHRLVLRPIVDRESGGRTLTARTTTGRPRRSRPGSQMLSS